jgi:ATP-dependent exoDNAse (exonuclease V) beta subunit
MCFRLAPITLRIAISLKRLVLRAKLRFIKLNTETQHHCIHKLKTHKLTEILGSLNITISENELTSKNILDTAIYLIDKLQLNSSINSNIYIRFFLDEISKYMVSHNSNINEFNDWWEKRSEKASLIISENINAVKIMTIHASKGLEFPVVIIPHCNWSFRHEEKWVEVEEENIPIKSAYIPMDKKAEQAGLGEYVKTEKQEILLDNINILYVAFTRAAEQLHVISSPSESNKKEGIWQIIDQYLKNQTILKPIEFGYELGEPINKKETLGKKTTPIQLEKMEIQDQLSAIKIKGSFLKNADKEEDAREKGIILHYILSKIKTFNDIENAINEVCMEGIVSESEIPELRTILSKLLLLPELKPYFSNNYQYKSERELLTTEGEMLRPDRIAFSGKETCIIDYKTGKEDLKKHQAQMLKYEKALMLMNYKNIKKILVYVENFKVIELS